MKRSFWIPAIVLATVTPTVFSQTPSSAPLPAGQAPALSPSVSTSYQIGEQGANYRVWRKIVLAMDSQGNLNLSTNRAYVELATGLNYYQVFATGGQWLPSREIVEGYPGGAIAQYGQHKVIFASNLNTEGAIDLQMSDGREMRSTILGLAYYDTASGKSVLIAETKDCQGQIVGSNCVVYVDAFDGVSANARFRYTRTGLEQDVILLTSPPRPEAFGLSSISSVLQVWTEFTSAPSPTIRAVSGAAAGSGELQDRVLDFGAMKMGMGHAFLAGENPLKGIRTTKQWVTAGARNILVESVRVSAIARQLAQLPVSAQAELKPTNASVRYVASVERRLPAAKPASKLDKRAMQLAKADPDVKHGLVLDYSEINSGQTDVTFQRGQTYLISGRADLDGNTIICGGAVVKYTQSDDAALWIWDTFECQTTPEHPAILTASDDDSVGETIAGSTGTPSGYYGHVGLFFYPPVDVRCIRANYMNTAFEDSEGDWDTFSDIQVVNSRLALTGGEYSGITVRNGLFCKVGIVFSVPGGQFNGSQVTLDRCGTLTSSYDNEWEWSSIYLTNCLFAAVTNLADSEYAVFHTNAVVVLADDTGVFQSAVGAQFYLASNSPYRDIGTTTIDPDLLAEIQTMTTYAPQDGGWPDTNTPDLGYHYPVNEDSDCDGLPDWWEWHWFGTYTNTGNQLDANGNTLLYDYQHGLDPNVIVFAIQATNDYVNISTPTLQLNVVAGVPFYCAVLVDSTNFDGATWTAYTSPNVSVSLGSMQGWHEIWIGLKGLPGDSDKTWAWKRLKLDFSPPSLVVTNPASSTVMQPMIELQGYCPEELDSISYDLTNAAGWFTNQQVLVLDRHYDTNTWEFTTNTFQGFDILLTNGLNTLTLHATDLAGNATNLTLNFTLDYSGKTNPPVVELYWPQDGAQISGSSFTWRGHVDDFTAQLAVQIVYDNGNTNTVNALVERDGNFWAENLPLTGGTNYLTLTATDAAGNSSITNITVVKSAVNLTINSVPSDQLWNRFVTVTGTIDAGGYSVWVNGVKAALNGTAWEADNVPTTPGGTAVFEARAIPNSDNGGNGTGGSGGSSASYADPGNPNSAQAHDADSQVDKPKRLYVESYSYSESCDIHPFGAGYASDGHQTYSFQINDACTWTLDWTDGVGGKGSEANSGDQTFSGTLGGDDSSWAESEAHQWPASFWPDLVDGTGTTSYTVTHNGQTSGGSWSGEVDPPYVGEDSWPVIAFEHCHVQGSKAGSASHSDGRGGYKTSKDQVNFRRGADTVMKLFTGGKAESKRQNIFALSATAQRPFSMSLKPNLLDDSGWWEYELPPKWGQWINIDLTLITIGELGQLGSDGILWVELPDGVTKDVTPKVKGLDYYTFDPPPPPSKYTPVIVANNVTLEPDEVVGNAQFCVGQYLTFGLESCPPYQSATFSWDLAGVFMNADTNPCPTCSTDPYVDDNLLKNSETTAWWVSGGSPETYTACVDMDLHFANGQTVSVSPRGQFHMWKPLTSVSAPMGNVDFGYNYWKGDPGPPPSWIGEFALHLGTLVNSDPPYGPVGIKFPYSLTIPLNFSGSPSWTQVANSVFRGVQTNDIFGHWWTMQAYHAVDGSLRLIAGSNTPFDSPALQPDEGVSPDKYQTYTAADDYSTWLMFAPSGGHSVPLKKINWHWSGTGEWSGGNPLLTAHDKGTDGATDTTDYPSWTNSLSNLNHFYEQQ